MRIFHFGPTSTGDHVGYMNKLRAEKSCLICVHKAECKYETCNFEEVA